MAPMSTALGLERFSALRQLDMQSVCDEDAAHGALVLTTMRERARMPLLSLKPAAVRQLAALSGSLQKLRLGFIENAKVE